ncbi:MAG: acetate uptake transporter [Solirubrobacterales bacterium]|nr:acetate uptake transporter [Solirubrobacterales bacterium]
MEAAQMRAHNGAREADVAPAPAPTERSWWTPADPAGLGLAGFALTTFILGMVNANAISGKDVFVVLSVAGAYGGLAQLLAGMWAFAERNTFAAIAFSSYGAFWISFVLLIQFFLPETVKASGMLPANHALALYLFCWGFFTLYMWFASFRVSVAVNLVFLTLWIAYVLLGVGLLGSGHSTITHWGGYVTIVCAVIAWYTAAALAINGTLKRTIVPVIPLSR